MRHLNDIGGLKAGPVPKDHHPAALWARLSTATFMVLSQRRRVVALDELRRTMEDMEPALYHRLSYFERQCQALANLLIERGVLGKSEIDGRIARLTRRAAASRRGKSKAKAKPKRAKPARAKAKTKAKRRRHA